MGDSGREGCCLLCFLLPSAPLSPSLCLPQVRSSLGTNILSATAAFAGTAILLMDFGVTNWVCVRRPQEGESLEKGRAISRRRAEARVCSTRRPGRSRGLTVPIDPMSVLTLGPYPREGWRGSLVEQRGGHGMGSRKPGSSSSSATSGLCDLG